MSKNEKANFKLLDILAKAIVKNPNASFSKLLYDYRFVVHKPLSQRSLFAWEDEYFRASDDILIRVEKEGKPDG